MPNRPWLVQHTNTAGEHWLAVVVTTHRFGAAALAQTTLQAEGVQWDGTTLIDALDTYQDFPGVIAAGRVIPHRT